MLPGTKALLAAEEDESQTPDDAAVAFFKRSDERIESEALNGTGIVAAKLPPGFVGHAHVEQRRSHRVCRMLIAVATRWESTRCCSSATGSRWQHMVSTSRATHRCCHDYHGASSLPREILAP